MRPQTPRRMLIYSRFNFTQKFKATQFSIKHVENPKLPPVWLFESWKRKRAHFSEESVILFIFSLSLWNPSCPRSIVAVFITTF
uniref:Uncharacterized protein n=1 Tax=Ciona intestinalis TaxID=7719 RepID=F6X2K4_CIOIN